MRTARLQLSLALLLCLGIAAAALAEDGLRTPRRAPFPARNQSADEDQVVAAQVTDSEASRSGFKLPELLSPPSLPSLPKPKLPKFQMPQWKWMSRAPSQPQPQGPSAWEKLTSGTKSFFSKTQATLLPWTVKKQRQRGADGVRRMASRPQRESETGIFSSLFSGRDEEDEINTVNDYLSLPRPEPYD